MGRRAVHSGAVQIVAQAMLLVMSLVSGLALARLLAPEDFGVMAMASTLTAFVATFRGFGISMALVQAKEVSEDDLHQLFRVGLRYALWLGAGMLVAAPALALMYEEPRLTAVIVAVTASSVAMSLAELPEALAIRAMRFAALRRVEVGSVAAGMAVALVTAWLGAGYWALVAQSATTGLVRAFSAWQLVAWRPRRRVAHVETAGPHSAATHSMLAFARRYATTNLATFAAVNIDRVTIGISSGTYAMGLYDLAYRWGHYPVWQLYAPLLNVAVAGLSRSRENERLYRHYWRTALLLILSVMLPALSFFVVEPGATILTLLGSGWTETIEVFRYVTIGGIALALSRHTRWLFLSEGRTREQLRMSLVQLAVMACAVAIGAQWKLVGVAVAYAVARWLLLVPELTLAFGQSPITWHDYRKVVWRPACASVVAGVGLFGVAASLPETAGPRLAVSALFYTTAYAVTWLALPGGRTALRELLGVARRMRSVSGTVAQQDAA
ncbi:MAG: oligosaccharide flippase family protein [Gemmatimonadaceae bacterium]|nr:oligosaccharide flippase family protein [Gemmatimonadaceae bacterium]